MSYPFNFITSNGINVTVERDEDRVYKFFAQKGNKSESWKWWEEGHPNAPKPSNKGTLTTFEAEVMPEWSRLCAFNPELNR